MKLKILIIAAIIFTAHCGKKIAQGDLKALLERGAVVVDVRTPAEFASGHHPRAINIPVDEVGGRLSEFGDKKKPVVVYCHSGSRSSQAKSTLEAAGFTAVTNAGGYRDLP